MERSAGRRRRVMKEEVLSASFAAYESNQEQQGIEPGDTPRYGAGANIENHPQVTDFVPRRYRIIGLVMLLGLSVGAVGELASHYAVQLSKWTQVLPTEEIRAIFSDRLLAWTSATMLLAVACYARLIYSLRRHRVDDYRGRYRVWRFAVWTAVALSINAVMGLHEPVARILGHITQWSLLPAHAGWWLVPTALLGGWLLVKLTLDARECRMVLLAYGFTMGCFGVAMAGSAGWSPAWQADFPGVLERTLPFAANLFLLIGTLLYARYVVLDVQGLIEHRETTQQNSEPAKSSQTAKTNKPVAEPAAQQAPEPDKWVDGSEPEHDQESQSPRRLSKAERKRQRKVKNQKRAA
ncbi:MAG: hypothetical protein MI725_14995 [Pirellulales bacterium]|nr:hypothetical protein [Pirellulales bacterium]